MFPLILENSTLPYIIAIFLMTIIFDIRTFSNLEKPGKCLQILVYCKSLDIVFYLLRDTCHIKHI